MNRTAVEQIKERLPIDVLVGSYVKLDKAGKSFKAKCPFHNEKSASFFVSPDRGGYYCFGCGAKGDIFSFVEQFEGLDFRGALRILAERAGVPLVYDQKADSERDRQFQLMELATAYFEDQFNKSKEAQEYVKSRGISDASRKGFRIGWAPDGWRNLSTYLKGKGWSDSMMEKVGLVKRKEAVEMAGKPSGPGEEDTSQAAKAAENSGRPAGRNARLPNQDHSASDHYDRFRGRIMFPITDSSGRVIAFSGRILKDDGKSAKYLNSPDTPLYDKSMVLYGLDKAKSEIRRMGYSIFVEGQMDLVMSHQAGIKNTVAASGTALGDEAINERGVVSNLGLVRRLSPNIIIAFDADSAGRKAAMRASQIALSIDMDVKIADIIGGKDPADLVKEDIGKWKDVLRSAKPVVEFELDNIVREFPDKKKRLKALQDRLYPLLLNISSDVLRADYIKLISDKAGISNAHDEIWNDLKVLKTRKDTEAKASNTKNVGGIVAQKLSTERNSRIDLAERQLFGIIFILENDKTDLSAKGANVASETRPDSARLAAEYRSRLKEIAGDSYDERLVRAESMKNDLMFETEEYFGLDHSKWGRHIDELMINFEEDVINNDLFKAMQELKAAERTGNYAMAQEFAKKCQELSIKKSEIMKKRS
jgi:DNA primase